MRLAPRPRSITTLVACLLAGLAAAPTAPALLNIDGTRNQVFVFGGLTYGYSSNMFAQAEGPSDYTVTAQVGAELRRRAGVIAVNSTAKLDFVKYGRFSNLDTVNPNFLLELVKTTGRTTGSFTLQAYRESRSDSAVNLRTSSWNYPVGLDLRYPLNQKFYVTSHTGYVRRNFEDHDLGLVNYNDYSQAVDLFYTYTSKLDLLGGYRVRISRTSVHGRTLDHWFSFGATGALFSKMSGTIRFGYQFRDVRDAAAERFNHFNAQASLNWPITRKLLLSLQANRDFNTIATGSTVDSTSLSTRAQYTFTHKIDLSGGFGAGRNDFLDAATTNRRDTFFSWDVGARYRLNDHFQLGAAYNYLHNWSSLANADFASHGFSVDVSGRY